MGNLKERLQDTLKGYMKSRDRVGANAVRMMMSAITMKEKEKGVGTKLSESDLIAVIVSYQKKVKEALESLRYAGRSTADAETELRIVESFLPSRLSDEEVRNLIEQKIAQLQSAGEEISFGPVMKAVMQEAKGRADGKVVNDLVKERLGS